MVYGEEGGLQAAGIGDLVGCEVAACPVQMPRGHLEGLHPPLQATPAASTTAFPSYAGVSGMEGGRPGFPLCMPAAPAGGCSMHFVDALQDRGRRGCCPWGDGKRRRPLLSRTRSTGSGAAPGLPVGSRAGQRQIPRTPSRAVAGAGPYRLGHRPRPASRPTCVPMHAPSLPGTRIHKATAHLRSKHLHPANALPAYQDAHGLLQLGPSLWP